MQGLGNRHLPPENYELRTKNCELQQGGTNGIEWDVD